MKAYGTRKPAEFYEVHVNMDNEEASMLKRVLETMYCFSAAYVETLGFNTEDKQLLDAMYLDYMRVYDQPSG